MLGIPEGGRDPFQWIEYRIKEEKRWSSALAGATSAILRPGFMYLSDLTDVVQGRGSEVTPAGGRRPHTEPSVCRNSKF